MPTQKEMWRICANNTIKCEELQEANLEVMLANPLPYKILKA